jgi:hypothetical protein
MEGDVRATELAELVKGQATKIADDLGPEEDWAPVIFLGTADTVHIALIDGSCLASPEAKKRLFTVMVPAQIREREALSYAYVMSTWQLKIDPKDDQDAALAAVDLARRIGVRNMPGRCEVLTVFAADRNDSQYWTADITRDEREVPSLGEWEQWPVDGRLEGYMVVDPVQALRGLEDM